MNAGTTCTTSPTPAPTFQKYIRFLPIVVSDFPEVRQKRANKYLILPPFALIRYLFALIVWNSATIGAWKPEYSRSSKETNAGSSRTLEQPEQINACLIYEVPERQETHHQRTITRFQQVMKPRGQKGMPVCYMESMQKGIPPPFRERQVLFTPIIFRTKNPEKSRLGLGEKISEKICGKMFRGKRKPPIL